MKISQKLALDGVSYRWWPRSLALGLIICAFLPYTYIWFVTSLTTLKLSICLMILQVSLAAQVQGAVNQVEGDPNGKANIRLTWANGIWIMIGLGLWSLGFMSAFLEQGLS